MLRVKMAGVSLSSVLLAAICAIHFTTSASVSMSFETVAKGYSSGIEDKLTEVVHSPEDFERFWRQHGSIMFPPPDVPTVDFQRDMIALIFRGTMNSGGYDLEVKGIDESDSEIVVRYETSDPQPGDMTTMALTQPFHIIRTSASGKAVRFEESSASTADPPFPAFILTFDKGADVEAIVSRIRGLGPVSHVRLMVSLQIAMVNFDSTQIEKTEARDLLEGIEGVKSVEEDTPF